MKRGSNKTVTVLIPCKGRERDGLATFLQEFAEPQPVKVVTEADFKAGSNRHQEAISTMWGYEKKQFMAVVALLKSLQSKDDLAIAQAREYVRRACEIKREEDKKQGALPPQNREFEQCLIPLFGLKHGQEKEALERWYGYLHGPRAVSDERWLLSQVMSGALETIRLVLWWSGDQFQAALYCSEPKAALYAFLLMKVSAGQGWGVCPKCGEFFVQRRSDQSYCSIAHREAHRVARWRAAKIARSRKKGGKHGTRKTR